MQHSDHPFPIPSCSSSNGKSSDDPTSPFSSSKPGQSVVSLVYHTKITSPIRVTWYRNLLLHGLSVSLEGDESANHTCRVELKPWCFWRKQGSKKVLVQEKNILLHVFWDLRSAKFSCQPEPQSNYYVALVHDDEIVLLLGDMKKEAYQRTGCRSAAAGDATLVSRKEHVYGKKRFSTRMRFQEKGRHHEMLIECGSSSSGIIGGKLDPQMVMKIDGQVMIHVKHLQWKFRGNEIISLKKERVEVYWDVHDWLFSPGLGHALFIFKPLPMVHSSFIASMNHEKNIGGDGPDGHPSNFCLFLYAWKIE